MAGIKISGGNASTNPTSGFLPYNNAGTFADSGVFQETASKIATYFTGTEQGLTLDNAAFIFGMGDFDSQQNGLSFLIDDTNRLFRFTGTGITSGSSGGASGQYLIINVAGTDYKLQLLNP
jgi:hypothetical protein